MQGDRLPIVVESACQKQNDTDVNEPLPAALDRGGELVVRLIAQLFCSWHQHKQREDRSTDQGNRCANMHDTRNNVNDRHGLSLVQAERRWKTFVTGVINSLFFNGHRMQLDRATSEQPNQLAGSGVDIGLAQEL